MTEAQLIEIERRASMLQREVPSRARTTHAANCAAVLQDVERLVALVRQHLLIVDDPLERPTVRSFKEGPL
jgi:hypothetical protein